MTLTREGFLTLVSARIDEEWFGLSFNEKCSDGYQFHRMFSMIRLLLKTSGRGT